MVIPEGILPIVIELPIANWHVPFGRFFCLNRGWECGRSCESGGWLAVQGKQGMSCEYSMEGRRWLFTGFVFLRPKLLNVSVKKDGCQIVFDTSEC